uniref:Uncharacterized protein n=1 Tax=Strongyloides venezuelensis TaxID=75913 RepID=A0A0K0G642_STRVS
MGYVRLILIRDYIKFSFIVQIIAYQLYERKIIAEPSIIEYLNLKRNYFLIRHIPAVVFFVLALGFHIGCIICLYWSKKSNVLFLYCLRIFVYICSGTIICYCLAFPLFISNSRLEVNEEALINDFKVTTLVHFSTENVISIFLFSLVTLAPFVISVPPVMHIYRKIKLNSKEHLCSTYEIN